MTATRREPGRLRKLLVAAVLLVVGAAIGFAVAIVRPGWPATPGATLSGLPGQPMDLEVVDGAGFATLTEGQVVSVRVESGRVTWTTAAEGLALPRGLAMTENRLFVVETGRVPCVSEPGCPEDPGERERTNIAASDARILSYPIEADGSLGEPQTLLDLIPVVSRDHGANDLEMGPDGMLYLAVGGVDYFWTDPAAISGIDHPHLDWLGSVLRVDAVSGEAEVWATGFRNVYGLAFSPEGRLFAVENDGPTLRGWRQEELMELTAGANYGYPFDGSFGPFDARTGFPIYALEPGGHAGLAWSGDGLLAGSCGRVERIPLIDRDGEYEVRSRVLIDDIAEVNGCVTSIVPVDGGLLVAAYGASGIYFIPNP